MSDPIYLPHLSCMIVLGAYGLCIYKLIARNDSNFQYGDFSQDHIRIACIFITIFFIVFSYIAMRKTGFLGKFQWLKLGALTYPLYLLHQTVGFKIFNGLFNTVNLHVLFWGTTLVMIFVSYWISQYIEKPLARYLKTLVTYFFNMRLNIKFNKNHISS